jgi:hypothetical protein
VTRTDPVPPPEQPTTEAGKRLLTYYAEEEGLPDWQREDVVGMILAIEAEARAAERRAVDEVRRRFALLEGIQIGHGFWLAKLDSIIEDVQAATDTPEENQ